MSRALPSRSQSPSFHAVGWSAADVAARGLRDDAPARRVLKDGKRGTIVWLDDAGPSGEAVVVKYFAPRSPLRRALALWQGSPARVQQRSAEALLAAGVAVPEPLGVVDAIGDPAAPTSALVLRAVVDGRTVKQAYLELGKRERRALARELGRFVARLHARGVYVPDLKESNLLVRRDEHGFAFVLVDLDRVRFPRGGLSARRRLANLVQLDRSIGRYADDRDRLAFLATYRLGLPSKERLSRMAATVDVARRRKDRSVARRRRRAGIKPEDRLPISCIIICGNEAHRIRDCLDSVSWCDEIVVVDSYSTDGTWDIVQEYTSNVARRAWTGHVDQKQYALDRAKHRWVLNVDADECVSPGLREEIEEVLSHDGRGYDGFLIPRVVFYLGRWWWRGGWYPDRRLRLFRRENAIWGGEDPHEKVLLRGRVGRLREPLWHYTYDDVSDHVSTINRFTTTAAERGEVARPASWNGLVLRPLGRFLRFYFLSRGFTLGMPGLFVAISAAVYVHLKYAKRDERARREAQGANREGRA
ncbi:MAG TPA: glycosyltransferase [Candidatus Binatia bacterium]